jgi:hypothetical protein
MVSPHLCKVSPNLVATSNQHIVSDNQLPTIAIDDHLPCFERVHLGMKVNPLFHLLLCLVVHVRLIQDRTYGESSCEFMMAPPVLTQLLVWSIFGLVLTKRSGFRSSISQQLMSID